jgi:hypothetical protein
MKPKTFTELLPVPLTEEDRAKLAVQYDNYVEELEQLEAEKRNLPKRIETVKEDLFRIAQRRRTGTKQVNVQCEEQPDYDQGNVRIVRLDTGETIRERIMSDEDRQSALFENPAGHDGSEVVREVIEEIIEELTPDHTDIGGTPVNTVRTRAELTEWAKEERSLAAAKVKRIYVDGNPYVVVSVYEEEKTGLVVAACSTLPIENANGLDLETAEERAAHCASEQLNFFYTGLKVNCGSDKKPDWWVLLNEETIFTEAPFESTVETPQPFEPIAAPEEPNPLTHKLDYQVNYALHSRTGAANRWAILRHMPENGSQDSVFLKACAMELSGHAWLSIAGDDCTWAISKKDGRIKFYTGTAQAKGTPALDADAFLETARRVLGIERKEVEGD